MTRQLKYSDTIHVIVVMKDKRTKRMKKKIGQKKVLKRILPTC